MLVFRTPDEVRQWSREHRAAGRTVGLVPTMGALHAGHTSLMDAAARECDAVVASIFVNPAQFAPNEDYDQYPRTWETDLAMAADHGVTAIYAPRADTMYEDGYATYVEVEGLQDGLCGITRPHFFRGVATVVTKLFNAVAPDKAYFGLKDGQQAAIIQRMVRDLDFGIEIVTCPTVRESDGLALSSRNKYLSPEERQHAQCISRSLFRAQERMAVGERDAAKLVAAVRADLQGVEVDYVSLVDAKEVTPVTRIEGPVMLAVAAKIGQTRLIDNIRFEPASNAVPGTPMGVREAAY